MPIPNSVFWCWTATDAPGANGVRLQADVSDLRRYCIESPIMFCLSGGAICPFLASNGSIGNRRVPNTNAGDCPGCSETTPLYACRRSGEKKSVADFYLRPLLQGLFRRSRHRAPRQFEKRLAFFFPQHDRFSCVSADADFRIEGSSARKCTFICSAVRRPPP